MSDLFSEYERAEAEAQRGMDQSAATAEQDRPGWSEAAYSLLCRFAADHPEGFTSEDVADAGEPLGLGSSKAWGAVYQRAARNGIIVKAGYAPTRRRHLSPSRPRPRTSPPNRGPSWDQLPGSWPLPQGYSPAG